MLPTDGGPSPEQQRPSLISALPLRTYVKSRKDRVFRQFLRIAEYFLKEKLYVEVPNSLATWPADAVPPLKIARLLREENLLSEWYPVPRDFPDEPYLYAFESVLDGEVLANGSDPFDKKAALIRMLAESYERAVWKKNDLSRHYTTRRCTYHDLIGERAIPPSTFSGFTTTQRDTHPLLRGRDDAPYTWVRIPSILGGRLTWVPLQTVSPLYHKSVLAERHTKEPLVRELTSNGLATGETLLQALTSGLLETIERDAFMVTYANAIVAPRLDISRLIEGRGKLSALLRECKRYNLTVNIVGLLTDFPVHCILAVIEDTTGVGPEIVVGGRAGFSLEDVAMRAVTEALYCRYIYRKEKLHERRLPEKISDYTPIDRIAHWGHPGMSAKLQFFTDKKAPAYTRTVNEPKTEVEQCKVLQGAVKKKELDALYVDYTDRIGKTLSWHSVLVVVPGLQPLYFNESAPHLGGPRIASIPRLYKLEPADTPPTTPHPFP